jgi:ATP-dependent Lon protease
VMKESARAALSWFRAHAAAYGADPDFFKNAEVHLHVPSGAIPKDGHPPASPSQPRSRRN